VLVICMSGNAFRSDWAQLEAGTFRFRHPLNQDRRFVPLRFDVNPIKSSAFLRMNGETIRQAMSGISSGMVGS
jgi:hypothetical protein